MPAQGYSMTTKMDNPRPADYVRVSVHAGVAVLTVDKGGRRPLLLIGVAGMVLSAGLVGVAVLAAYYSMAVTYLSIVGLFIFVGSYQVGTLKCLRVDWLPGHMCCPAGWFQQVGS